MKPLVGLLCFWAMCCGTITTAQTDTLLQRAADTATVQPRVPLRWHQNAPSFHKARFAGVTAGCAGLYGAALTGLSVAWYSGYDKSRFHWFDDGAEWNQIDKTGHVYAPYFISTWTYDLYRWSGLTRQQAAWTSGAIGFAYISTIEVLDGFSAKWGASWSDLAANFAGSAIATTQYLLWGEQRILIKYSLHEVKYNGRELRQRADELYGKSFGEKILKDYNGINMWLSFNLHSFNHRIKPQWLNIAFGYGAGNMFGGFDNTWFDKDGNYHDRKDVKRYRKFLISVDADYTKIKTNSKAVKVLLKVLNIVKLPMPAVEFNTLGQVVLHPLYFLNWEYPIVIPLKK